MNRRILNVIGALVLLGAPLVWTACRAADGKTNDQTTSSTVVSVSPAAATEQSIARFIRVTGSLTAEEQADVAAETPGRVIGSPVERGTPVQAGVSP